jgi:hypothetical protein
LYIFGSTKFNFKTMKQVIQNLGLIIFLIAIITLVIGITQGMSSNSILVISGGLIVLGLVAHVLLGKRYM